MDEDFPRSDYLPSSDWYYAFMCKDIGGAVEASAECKVDVIGASYSGTVAQTSSGLTCQAWSSQSPHNHNMNDPDDFPDSTIADAANYCRNPDGSPTAWCFTEDGKEDCDICPCDQWGNLELYYMSKLV